MINLFLDCFFESWKDIFSLGAVLASWATVIGVVGAFIAAFIALKTYRSNNSIRKWELTVGMNFTKEFKTENKLI
jgi:Na+-driven multidrug efflux pump